MDFFQIYTFCPVAQEFWQYLTKKAFVGALASPRPTPPLVWSSK